MKTHHGIALDLLRKLDECNQDLRIAENANSITLVCQEEHDRWSSRTHQIVAISPEIISASKEQVIAKIKQNIKEIEAHLSKIVL